MITIHPSVGRANIKIGPIRSFSLPSRFTCPGATKWCRENCYAARFEHIRPSCRLAYARNLMLTWNTRRFVRVMLKNIPNDLPVFRIHVSGDYYDRRYVAAWASIASKRPNTQFFAYTRSWIVPELRTALEALRALPNCHVFASVDPEMPDPPAGWRIAYLNIDPRANGVPCLHQQGKAASCYECRYCFRPGKGNVIFKVH
ncbi:MAG: hypothetical protein HUU46_19255 [Candidatus Hydrogenedentes bacterium]|nr:hypothetical protein [Candidatus Hydrogenedentota bacterium]